MIQKVIRNGHSLCVTLPKRFVEAMGIKKGDRVAVERRPDKGLLLFRFDGVQQLVLSETVLRPPRKKAGRVKSK